MECKKAGSKAHYAANTGKIKAAHRAWQAANPEKYRESIKSWRAANPKKCKAYTKEYNLANRGKRNARVVERKAGKLQATPGWANKFFIDEIYDLAQLRTKATGFKWEVDHIVPLKSKLVCGLHCEQNLAVITRKDNITKGNWVWQNMP